MSLLLQQPTTNMLWESIIQASCQGRVSDAESLIHSNKNMLTNQQGIMAYIINLYYSTKGNGNDSALVSVAWMLVRAGVGHKDMLALKESSSDPYDIKWWLPTSDPIENLFFSLPAIRSDINEREKLGIFFAFSKWGKLIGRDVVQTHILPHIVVFGGTDQTWIDGILQKYEVPTQVCVRRLHFHFI